jgi:hypothetical protein
MLKTSGTQVVTSLCIGVSFFVLDDDVHFIFRFVAGGGHSCVI